MTINLIRDFVLYSELISAVAGTVFLYKYKNTYLKYFLFLLWYIVLTEFFTKYCASKTGILIFYTDENGNRYTVWFYNLLRFITYNTLFFIYYNYLNTKYFRRRIKIFAILYTSIYILNWLFVQNFHRENSEIPKIIGSLFLIATIIFFFIELLRSEKIVAFHKMLLFWISVGLLLYYSGTIPFSLQWNGYAIIPGVHDLFLIVYILAIIMYSIFTFGFIWSKKE